MAFFSSPVTSAYSTESTATAPSSTETPSYSSLKPNGSVDPLPPATVSGGCQTNNQSAYPSSVSGRESSPAYHRRQQYGCRITKTTVGIGFGVFALAVLISRTRR